jgi:hypothetical protein
MINQDSPYANYRRDGLNRLLKLAQALCAIVTTFAGIIRSKYEGNPNIIALLAAIEAVCELLPPARDEFESIPSDDPLPPTNSTDITGINPNAPPAPSPEVS